MDTGFAGIIKTLEKYLGRNLIKGLMVGVYVILAVAVLLAALELMLYVVALLAHPSVARRLVGLVVYGAFTISLASVLTIATQRYINRRFRPEFMRQQDKIDQQTGELRGMLELVDMIGDKTKLMLTEMESRTEGMEQATGPGRLKIVIGPDGVERRRFQQNRETGDYEPLAAPSDLPMQWRMNEETGHYEPLVAPSSASSSPGRPSDTGPYSGTSRTTSDTASQSPNAG